MQLCQLTGCKVDLKIYSEEENSLLAYTFNSNLDAPTALDSYLKLQNKDYDLINCAELSITRTFTKNKIENKIGRDDFLKQVKS